MSLGPDAIFGSLNPVETSLLTDQLRSNDEEKLERDDDKLIIGTQCMYLFFRLHQVLIHRLNIAKKLAMEVSNDSALGRHIEKITYEGDPDEGKKRYDAFLGLVYSLIDSGIASSELAEGGRYEDRVRHLLGNNAYELTTMDKLISHVLKHLQHMANDDIMQNMIEVCLILIVVVHLLASLSTHIGSMLHLQSDLPQARTIRKLQTLGIPRGGRAHVRG